jgi:MinD superfamily P-loop ATPase
VRSGAEGSTPFHLSGVRLALALGDQELEQRLRPDIETAEDLVIVAQCLAADQLAELVHSHQVDAAVVAWTLHRLTDTVLDQLERPGVTLVLLVPDPADDRWRQRAGPVLPLDTDPQAIREAILAGRPGLRPVPRPVPTSPAVPLELADRVQPPLGGVVAVTGGAGSPGRTTIALNLVAALGAAVPAVLVELDLCAPAVAAYVDADPSRNVCTLAHTVGDDPHAWTEALVDELQPLSTASTHAQVLCGPPKREMRTNVSAVLVERLVDELAQRFQWVILDVGPEWLGLDAVASVHRAALARAEHLMLVSAPDLVGLWHARTALDQLQRLFGVTSTQVNLVLNRHDPAFHHTRQEVEWHLGAPAAAVIPLDHRAMQQAIADQQAVVLNGSSRAGRALVRLAEGMHAGKLHLPMPASRHERGPWWRRVLGRQPRPVVTRSLARVEHTRAAAVAGSRSRGW